MCVATYQKCSNFAFRGWSDGRNFVVRCIDEKQIIRKLGPHKCLDAVMTDVKGLERFQGE